MTSGWHKGGKRLYLQSSNDIFHKREGAKVMKALVLQGIKDLAVQDYETPSIKPDEVLVHTAFAGICGTDKA